MDLTWRVGLLVGFGLILAASAQLVVKTAAILAHKLGLASYTVAFLLLGLLTSAPEMFVAVQSLVEGVPQLSMGNLIGGSILLLSLVMGVSSVLMGRITLDHGLSFGEILLTSAIVASPVAVLWDGSLTRLEGLFLIGTYAIHAILVTREDHILSRLKRRAKKLRGLAADVGNLVVGFVAMLVASRVIVESAQAISATFGIAPFVFGLVLLSFGTNLPEFSLAIQASLAGRRIIAFGDFLGSAAANTLVLGLLGVAAPFSVTTRERLWFSLVFLGSVTAFFVWALSSRRDITRKEGIGLLLFYTMFVLFELLGGA